MSSFSSLFSWSNYRSSQRRDSETSTQSQTSSRQSTGRSQSTTSSSGSSTGYPYSKEISGRFIDKRKLQALLRDEFGNDYQLQLRSNNYRLCTRRKLSEEKVLSCF